MVGCKAGVAAVNLGMPAICMENKIQICTTDVYYMYIYIYVCVYHSVPVCMSELSLCNLYNYLYIYIYIHILHIHGPKILSGLQAGQGDLSPGNAALEEQFQSSQLPTEKTKVFPFA